jgi:hypothetical protein
MQPELMFGDGPPDDGGEVVVAVGCLAFGIALVVVVGAILLRVI